ncbi:hypothetical protein ACFBZI_08800 [Moraxella sp. ZJ142]|uniref:hypothetical protein n=1 Tax=Moraxella marmotae TaxID=3344520 RepID=UPI0035D51F7B
MSVLTLNVKFKVKALQGLMAKGGGSMLSILPNWRLMARKPLPMSPKLSMG